MTRGSLRVERLGVTSFRNIERLELEPALRLNVIAGDNGQGKTSIIEALYLAATSRSFRTHRLAEVIRQGDVASFIALTVEREGYRTEQRVQIGARGRSWLLDGKKPARLVDYATRTPVVVFHPGDLALVSGSAEGRRTLLDRVALFESPLSGNARLSYGRALRSRQRLLDERGPKAPELDAVEIVAARHGTDLCRARQQASLRISAELGTAFARLSSAQLELTSEYLPRGCFDPREFAQQLALRRDKDRARRSASFGPQRDELWLSIDGREAKSFASQGQQRLLALSLKMAELACVAETSRLEPILLLDDVSSELDPKRTGAVYEFLRDTKSQVFVTTTRPELFVTPALSGRDRADFVVSNGRFV